MFAFLTLLYAKAYLSVKKEKNKNKKLSIPLDDAIESKLACIMAFSPTYLILHKYWIFIIQTSVTWNLKAILSVHGTRADH